MQTNIFIEVIVANVVGDWKIEPTVVEVEAKKDELKGLVHSQQHKVKLFFAQSKWGL